MGESRDDKQWVLQCRNGDTAAFEELVRGHQRMIHSLAFRMTGSMADAEDLAQETFIQAFQSLGDFRGDSAFSSWLYRIAVNKCINWRRREQRRERFQREFLPDRNESASFSATSGSMDHVQQALMKLNPKQRAAVVLTICEGQSHAEAARALGCSETTISWRVFSAKRKMRHWLGKSFNE